MGGLRGDHSSEYGYFITPRFHVKYNPNEYVHFRLFCLGRAIVPITSWLKTITCWQAAEGWDIALKP